jgi:hypothetical protein
VRKDKHKCGCVSNATHWLTFCPEHRAESDAYTKAFMEHRNDGWDRTGAWAESVLKAGPL